MLNSSLAKDQALLDPLVERILELAGRPSEENKKELWARHNALQTTVKAPVCVTFEGIPDPQWNRILGRDACSGSLARQIERYLKKRIWAAENIPDDHVVWPAVAIPACQEGEHDWGVPTRWQDPEDELGARRIEPPFAEKIDLSRLRQPKTCIDEAATHLRLMEARTLVRGRLSVHPVYPTLGESPFEQAVMLRGMENLYLDVYDNPQMIRELMAFITEAIIQDHQHREARGWLNCPVDPSGQYQMVARWRHVAAYANGLADRKPGIGDEWPYVSAQSSIGLGPEMYHEFVQPYNARISALYERNVYYHGCECLDQKIDSVAALPNLRRHHVSPWSSVPLAVKKYGGRAVLEVHAHPTEVMLCGDSTLMRKELDRLVRSADGHPMSLNLSDIHCLDDRPETLCEWARLAQDVLVS